MIYATIDTVIRWGISEELRHLSPPPIQVIDRKKKGCQI